MKKEEIISIIKKILVEENVNFKSFDEKNLNASLNEFGIDSLQKMSIIVHIEEQLHITIPDEKLSTIKSFAELIDIIISLVK